MPKQAAGPLRTQNPSFSGSTDVTELTLHWVRQAVAQAGGTVNHVAVVVVVQCSVYFSLGTQMYTLM